MTLNLKQPFFLFYNGVIFRPATLKKRYVGIFFPRASEIRLKDELQIIQPWTEEPLLGSLDGTSDPTCVAVCLCHRVFRLLLVELCMDGFGGAGLGGGAWGISCR